MMRIFPAYVLALTAAPKLAAAEPPIAYVDEIVIAGGPEVDRAREFAAALVQRAGLRARFSESGNDPCGDDPACLALRARRARAAVALRLAIADVGGRVTVALLAVDGAHVRREIADDVDLGRADDGLAAAVRELLPAPRFVHRRLAAWSLLVTSAALAIGGGGAVWHAHDLKQQFFAAHVAANGDVYGISPAEARVEEARARRWSLLGGIALAGAGIAGVSATVMFIHEPDRSRPVGLSVAMELP
jgi:hypothetical protein